MANHPVGSRDDWKALKKKYGIPDGVCKFSLGEKINSLNKALDAVNPGDFEPEIDALEEFLPLMRTYEAAFKKLKPSKFKDKSESEQATSYKKAKEDVERMLKVLQQRVDFVKMQSRPMAHLLKHYQDVVTTFKSLANDCNDKDKVSRFYSQDMRNTLGLAVSQARKLALGQSVLAALDEYTTAMEGVDDLIQGRKKPINPSVSPYKTAYLQCGRALAALKDYLK